MILFVTLIANQSLSSLTSEKLVPTKCYSKEIKVMSLYGKIYNNYAGTS